MNVFVCLLCGRGEREKSRGAVERSCGTASSDTAEWTHHGRGDRVNGGHIKAVARMHGKRPFRIGTHVVPF